MSQGKIYLIGLKDAGIDERCCLCGVAMLPAAEGDSIIIRMRKADGDLYNILVDCGTYSTGRTNLKRLKAEMIKRGEVIDLLVLTHIDGDHIGGALPLLSDTDVQTAIRGMWYNGLGQLIYGENRKPSEYDKDIFRKVASEHRILLAQPENEISTQQAITVSSLIQSLEIPLNRCNGGDAICEGLPTIEISPDIKIDVLLPTKVGLRELYYKFLSEVASVSMKADICDCAEGAQAFENVMFNECENAFYSGQISKEDKDLDLICNIEKWSKTQARRDSSVTNAASIAFCLRYFDKLMLFPGDAPSEELVPALKSWSKKQKCDLQFDLVKLPHHGAFSNNKMLFEEIDARIYLLSTDGKKFPHPSKETISAIITRPATFERLLVFNYANEMYHLFSNPVAEARYSYKTLLQEDLLDMESW